MIRWLKEHKKLDILVEPRDRSELLTESSSFNFVHTWEGDEEALLLHTKVDLVTLGGDGTVLWGASLFKGPVPPVIAFSLGSLGFMTPFYSEHYKELLDAILQGPISITFHHRLQCHVIRESAKHELETDELTLVLNEVTIDRGISSFPQDPFYIVKEEIQESIDTLLSTFHGWENLSDTREQEHLSKELLASCESIEWQVDELDKTITVAAREPAFYGIGEVELGKRQKWTRIAHDQVNMVRKAVSAGKGLSFQETASVNGMHRELMRLQVGHTPEMAGSNQYAHENDDILSSESDRQLLLIKQQDEELDELSASVQRIGHVGLTIHDELHGQERILDELGREMDSTSNRLDFLQKKVAVVMKKAGDKGQFMMILFLI
ncbi:hypothetical protein Nepgr_024085 [Nepenthes gracilis]|uniref:t-SNARE coiled-coil homology domain-containing protein n=1 Tax=Nepenthes gracilis TaxID=150966 RepID=A0AAD3XYA1_NEPGR|nr:hypothetical protein Nepgr_024085 [Nepenthes gracilis]